MDPAALRHHFDNLDPEFHAEFWGSLAWMRAECPVTLSDRHGGFWFVTRYDDVRSVCEDWRRFTSTQGLAIPPAPMPSLPPISVDPPEQRDWRHLLNPYFAPASLAHLEPRIREVADRFVDDFVEAGRCDIVADFASVFPGAVFFELVLGAERRDVERLLPSIGAVGAQTDSEDAARAWMELDEFSRRLLTEGSTGPTDATDAADATDGPLRAIRTGRVRDQPIEHADQVNAVMLLVVGGLDTTMSAIGSIVGRLCEDAALRDRLAGDLGSIPAALDEFLRIEPPIVSMARTATEDVELGGARIKAGDKVLVSFAGANRDPAEFDDPDRLDLDRERNRHLAFGAGPHRCIGSHLARLNITIALQQLLTRLPDIHFAPGAGVSHDIGFRRGIRSVPVEFTPGRRVTRVAG